MNSRPTRVASRFFRAADGLQLHMRDYGSQLDPGVPVVCLAGLTRSAADFDIVARALSGSEGGKRRVVALDYRGRGLSGHDPDWRNYDLPVEHADILTVLAAAGIDRAIFLGTSRGGLHTMLLAAAQPALVHAAILNDVGPVLETSGLLRIRDQVGKGPQPQSLAEAVALLKQHMSMSFNSLSETDWQTYARMTFEDEAGRFGLKYDPHLMQPLRELDLTKPLPTLWPQFEALRDVPLLVLRGANSDLLTASTLAEMAGRHSRCTTVTVEGQGHAPLLLDQATVERICRFVAEADPA